MTVGILAVQGAFIEHAKVLERLGVDTIELRQKKDTLWDFDALILPGGESTVQSKLLKELDMFDILHQKISDGLPTLATCAGLILLASGIEGEDTVHFGTLPVTVKRNAYGRQLGSFYTEDTFGELESLPMTFIRAPYVTQAHESVDILSTVDDHIVGVRYDKQIGVAFHPELDEDTRIHEMLLSLIEQKTEA